MPTIQSHISKKETASTVSQQRQFKAGYQTRSLFFSDKETI